MILINTVVTTLVRFLAFFFVPKKTYKIGKNVQVASFFKKWEKLKKKVPKNQKIKKFRKILGKSVSLNVSLLFDLKWFKLRSLPLRLHPIRTHRCRHIACRYLSRPNPRQGGLGLGLPRPLRLPGSCLPS